MPAFRLKQVVGVLNVGGLLWGECGWLFWGCFVEERVLAGSRSEGLTYNLAVLSNLMI